MVKQFILGLGNKNDNGNLKNRILNKIATTYPFLKWNGIDTEEDPAESIQYTGPGDCFTFGINPKAHFSAINKKYYRPNTSYFNPNFAGYVTPKYYSADTELDLAMARLHDYANFIKDTNEDKGYDFIYEGQPVRVYPKFIQIGYTIIPTENYKPIFKAYEETQPNLINIIINISKTEEITNIYN